MDRRPRLADVAAHVGVSPASVSMVLRGAPGPSAATRQRVLDAAAALGYRADRTAGLLARHRRHLLGVLLDVRDPFHAELADAVRAEADRVGYETVLSTVARGRDESRAVDTLLDLRCGAVLLLGTEAPDGRLAALAGRVPVVAVGRRSGEPGVDVVRSADDLGVGAAVAHLARLGHRRIAFVDGGRGAVASLRRRGYHDAMRRAGIADRIRVVPGSHTEDGGARAGWALAAGPDRPTAVVASNDRCAVGVLDAFRRAGLHVPGDVSVTGYDDSGPARLAPIDLTSVDSDAAAQARHAVAAAVSRLDDGRTERREVVLAPRLVVRGSTGAPPPR